MNGGNLQGRNRDKDENFMFFLNASKFLKEVLTTNLNFLIPISSQLDKVNF